MKVLHLMLSCFYIDNFSYQENILPRQNKKDGHIVKIIASTESFINGKLDYVQPRVYLNEDEIEVVRLPYKRYLPHYFMRKLRLYIHLYEHIEKFDPDIILCHGLPFIDIKEVVKYKRNHNRVKLFLDSHEDYSNSGLSFVSKYILHNLIYRYYLKRAYKYVEKIFYLSPETKEFIIGAYHAPAYLLEYWPLGGELINKDLRISNRKEIQDCLGFSGDEIVFVHSGKMDKLKRTEELLNAFISVKDKRFRLVIIGCFSEDIEKNATSLINCDDRILFLGWKNSNELQKYLCAADMYLQPGSQSVTLQNAMCCGAGVMLFPYPIYKYFVKDNGFYVKSYQDIVDAFEQLSIYPELICEYQKKAFAIAENELDYAKISNRYL